tara:strand:- start:22253 stop:22660 length:408 start_codon:yes stop_codon:yes gene_type:complete
MMPAIILSDETVAKKKASDYFLEFKDRNGDDAYVVLVELRYYSHRYNRWVVCNVGDVSDGATGAYDIDSFGWLFHDDLCNTGEFESGSKCTNWQASMVVYDILRAEGRYIRAITWKYATFIGGGGKARKNGMFKL